MNSVERVTKTIEFGSPDRFPIMHAVLPAAWLKYKDSLHSILKKYPSYLNNGLKNGDLTKSGQASAGYDTGEEIARQYVIEDDFIFIGPRSYQYGPNAQKGFQSDEWGCIWEKEDPGIAGQVIYHPLSGYINNETNRDSINNYNFPDPDALWRYDVPFLTKQKEYSKKHGKYFLAYLGNLFELLQWLFGFENLMTGFYTEKKKIYKILKKITNFNIRTMKNLSKYNIKGVIMNDDWGTQNSLMINPDTWREFFKPAYKEIISESKNLNLHSFFHTDGNTIEIIEDLIEIGVDVINPQLSAMDMEKLSDICKGRVCMRTDIDRQHILPYGSKIEVRGYVRRVIELFGTKKGGLILSGEINSDTNLENIEEMYKSFEKYGVLYK